MKNPGPGFLLRLIFILAVLSAFFFTPKSLAASTWQKHTGNPILNNINSGWNEIHNPTLINSNNIYKMLYESNNGSGWRIGSTTSINGINSWIKNTQPAISVGSNDGWESEIADPTILYRNLNTYQLWYTSINTSHWASGLDRFRTRYATSNDGITWTKSAIWALKGTVGSWDEGGTARGKSILHKDNLYHLWYTGTDSGMNWRIGYATSADGTTWTKQNNGNAVITPTASWELNNVSYPNVIYENGIYKMWYAAGLGDLPTQIVYATSTDGINWTKPQDQNPVLTRSSSGFDSVYVASPFVLHEGNTYKMWYSGFNGQWSIGYATKSTGLDIPLLKQTDSRWNNQEYDSATLWSNDITIDRWGCALVSATMILKYHGINKLVDGTGLDPGTLNTWLKNQTDGYVGTGWINWLAVSRLSKLAKNVNNITAFDALEYTRINSADKNQLTTDLNNARPGILEEPGHFIVAKAINDNTFDINDPYYDRFTLNDGYNNTFLSLGRYTPSNTNLSYLMFAIDPAVELLLTNSSGQKTGSNGTTTYDEINNASYYTQQSLINPVNNQSNLPIKILMIPKPSDGIYTISVATTSSIPKGFSLKIYEYITDGTPTVNAFSGYSRQDEQAKFSIDYQQNPSGSLETPEDITPPQIKSAKTLDKDKNGKLDTIRIEFIRDIYGNTVNGSGTDFQVDGYTVVSADEVSDGVIEIIIEEKNSNDTGQTPTVILKGDGNGTNTFGVKDKLTKKYNNQQTITPTDEASPTKPAIDIEAGDYMSSQSATLTSSDSPNSPTIYYTLDGTDPATSNSRTTYADPITINDDLTLKAVSIDDAGNLSEILTKTYGIAPTIHSNTISATSSASSFTVVWTTNRPSFSRVVFGTASKKVLGFGTKFGYENTTNETHAKTKNHSVTITDLTPGKTYYYRVISKGSPEQIADEQSVTIPAASPTPTPTPISTSSETPSLSSSSSNSSSSSSSSSPPVCNDQKPGSAPTLISAFPGINTVTLTWSEAKYPVSYYLVAYGTESEKPLYGNPDIGGKGTTSFVVENLSGGVTYYFKIRAGNGCTPGDYSNEIAATPIGFAEEGIASGFKENVLGASNKHFVTSKPTEVKPTAPEVLSFKTKTPNKQKDIKLEFILISFGFIFIASAVYLTKTFLKKS